MSDETKMIIMLSLLGIFTLVGFAGTEMTAGSEVFQAFHCFLILGFYSVMVFGGLIAVIGTLCLLKDICEPKPCSY